MHTLTSADYDWVRLRARAAAATMPMPPDADEAAAVALSAAVRAARRWRSGRGARYRTYAGPAVTGAVQELGRRAHLRWARRGDAEEARRRLEQAVMADAREVERRRNLTLDVQRVVALMPWHLAEVARRIMQGGYPPETMTMHPHFWELASWLQRGLAHAYGDQYPAMVWWYGSRHETATQH